MLLMMSVTSTGKSAFHTFIPRSLKEWAMLVVEKCGLYNVYGWPRAEVHG